MSTHAQTLWRPAVKPSSFTPVRSGLLQRKCACDRSGGLAGECSECGNKKLQRKSFGNQKAISSAPPIVHEALSAEGQPLEDGTRSFMEARLGHDFSRVRVHTYARAAESAQAVNALAYTVGRDVVFRGGQYAPETGAGRRLLAHELAHVVQQTGGTVARTGTGGLEHEADAAAKALESGRTADVSAGAAPAGLPQFAEPESEHPEKPTPQDYINQHYDTFGLNLNEESLGADLFMMAWQSPNHYEFVLSVFKLLDTDDQPQAAEAFFDDSMASAFVDEIALNVTGRDFLRAMFDFLPEGSEQRPKITKAVTEGKKTEAERKQTEREKERLAALEELKKKGNNISLNIYTAYEGEDIAESMLKSVAEERVKTKQTDAALPMEYFNDIGAYLDAIAKETKASEFIRELRLLGHGTEDNFGFGRHFYNSQYLRDNYGTGLYASYMAEGATIALDGCNVAKGEAGKNYMSEIGRIFFGEKKTGYLRGNTCENLGFGAVMTDCGPRTMRWPGDFK